MGEGFQYQRLLLGHHGCDQSVVDVVLKGNAALAEGDNKREFIDKDEERINADSLLFSSRISHMKKPIVLLSLLLVFIVQVSIAAEAPSEGSVLENKEYVKGIGVSQKILINHITN